MRAAPRSRAVAAAKAVDLHAHLLALEIRRETQEHHDGVGLLGGGNRCGLQRLVGRRPDQLKLCVAVRFLRVHAKPICAARLET